MKNWKTSLVGALMIVGAVANLGLEFLKTGTVTFQSLQATGATIAAGVGFISAKDANPTEPPKNIVPLAVIGFSFGALLALTGCANGRYIGPSIGFSGGYNGMTMGVTLYGDPVPYGVKAAIPTKSGTAQVELGIYAK